MNNYFNKKIIIIITITICFILITKIISIRIHKKRNNICICCLPSSNSDIIEEDKNNDLNDNFDFNYKPSSNNNENKINYLLENNNTNTIETNTQHLKDLTKKPADTIITALEKEETKQPTDTITTALEKEETFSQELITDKRGDYGLRFKLKLNPGNCINAQIYILINNEYTKYIEMLKNEDSSSEYKIYEVKINNSYVDIFQFAFYHYGKESKYNINYQIDTVYGIRLYKGKGDELESNVKQNNFVDILNDKTKYIPNALAFNTHIDGLLRNGILNYIIDDNFEPKLKSTINSDFDNMNYIHSIYSWFIPSKNKYKLNFKLKSRKGKGKININIKNNHKSLNNKFIKEEYKILDKTKVTHATIELGEEYKMLAFNFIDTEFERLEINSEKFIDPNTNKEISIKLELDELFGIQLTNLMLQNSPITQLEYNLNSIKNKLVVEK